PFRPCLFPYTTLFRSRNAAKSATVSSIFKDTTIKFQFCADDTEYHISFSASNSFTSLTSLFSALGSFNYWITLNLLPVNSSKTRSEEHTSELQSRVYL